MQEERSFAKLAGPPLKVPLATLMPKNAAVWTAMQKEHNLKVRSVCHSAASSAHKIQMQAYMGELRC